MQTSEAVASTEWLAAHLGEPDLRVVDATWRVLHPVGPSAVSHRPPASSTPHDAFTQAHIPGAVFFDIEAITDTEASLPQMLPTPERFERLVGNLGIGDGDRYRGACGAGYGYH